MGREVDTFFQGHGSEPLERRSVKRNFQSWGPGGPQIAEIDPAERDYQGIAPIIKYAVCKPCPNTSGREHNSCRDGFGYVQKG